MHLPPIVIECKVCGEKYLLSNTANRPSEKMILFSDGYYSDSIIWRNPEIIGCVTCELGFFVENGKRIAEPGWDTFQAQWAHLKQAAPPSASALAMEIRIQKCLDAQNEKRIRKEFWYAGNHTETGKYLLKNNQKFNAFWHKSLSHLEQLLTSDIPGELLLKAEINRQLGNFGQCISLLKEVCTQQAISIRKQAENNNRAIIEIPVV
jgi:hypothetical protein